MRAIQIVVPKGGVRVPSVTPHHSRSSPPISANSGEQSGPKVEPNEAVAPTLVALWMGEIASDLCGH
jgi:hypothetical protein